MSLVFDIEAMYSFALQLRSEAFRRFWQGKTTYDVTPYYPIMDNYIEESVFGLRLLRETAAEGRLPGNIEQLRILEVGAGAGILTAWLLQNNIDAWGIEPSGLGYDFHAGMFASVKEYYQLPEGRIIDAAAEDLTPLVINKVDVIFSVNVVEHIKPQNLQAAFNGMKSVLSPRGMMFHHCPNYIVPFEPHYGLPLVPFFPHLTGKIKGVYNDGVWQSLNFITYFKIKLLAKKAGLQVTFKKALMAEAFTRLAHDGVYASRHKMLTRLYSLLKYSGFIWGMRQIPPSLCTPMTFYLR